MNIQIIPQQNINLQLWDACIEQSSYGRIYATTTYLNTICKNWLGLVYNNYEMVMPIPFNKKYGINYVYFPAFIQQLGVYSKKEITDEIVHQFINSIPKKYKYIELCLNAQNTIGKGFKMKNYIMPLNAEYDFLKNNYSRQAKRNITKAIENNIEIKENIEVEQIVNIHRKRFNDAIGSKENDYFNFIKLANQIKSKNQCLTIGAFLNNELIAGSVYWIFNNRITFILNGNSRESLEVGASHLLKDYIIKKYAKSNYLIDFEGSETESFARFYEQFGAKEIEYYTHLKINNLPFYLKWFKK